MSRQTPNDGISPTVRWAFDEAVTIVFDDMLRRSIPQYDDMRAAVASLGRTFVRPGTDVVDLGCSRGEALLPFVRAFGSANRFVGVEVSPPMLAAVRDRFAGDIDAGVVEIQPLDLRGAYPTVVASLTLAILTLQFIPIECRQRVIQNVYDHTLPGGAFILVEKVLGETAGIDRLLVANYYDLKVTNGYSQEEINRKRLALEGTLVPVLARWNEELLRLSGFRQVDCFWRWMNFAGFIAIK